MNGSIYLYILVAAGVSLLLHSIRKGDGKE